MSASSAVCGDLNTIQKVAAILADSTQPMKARYRALFTLKNIGGKASIDAIATNFADESNLLKHEMAYCLGQMQDEYALTILREIVRDNKQHVIVRHEAAEALGAIGKGEDLQLLHQYAKEGPIELKETCQIAIDRINWLTDKSGSEMTLLSQNPYNSVDPAPPCTGDQENTIPQLTDKLLDASLSLFERYRAMFSLRNMSSEDSVIAITKGFSDSSALFRHEVAYVLGQLSHPASEPALTDRLEDMSEHGMVRHECAEALGSVATKSCMETLNKYLNDSERLVRESCEVALDMCEYEMGNEFQYANTAILVNQ